MRSRRKPGALGQRPGEGGGAQALRPLEAEEALEQRRQLRLPPRRLPLAQGSRGGQDAEIVTLETGCSLR